MNSTPNFSPREDKVSYVVIHEAQKKENGLYFHFFIYEDNGAVKLAVNVPADCESFPPCAEGHVVWRALHVGYYGWSDSTLLSTARIAATLAQAYGLSSEHVLLHSDASPGVPCPLSLSSYFPFPSVVEFFFDKPYLLLGYPPRFFRYLAASCINR